MIKTQRIAFLTIVFVATYVQWTPAMSQLNPNSTGQGLALPGAAPAAQPASAPTASSASGATLASDRKRELAGQLVQAQRGPEMVRLAGDLAQTAVGPVLEPHLQRVSRLPKPQQDRAMAQLEALADKLGNEVAAEVRNNLIKFDSEVLLPEYMQLFSDDEISQLVAFFNSEAVRKYQAAAPRLGEKLVQKVIEASRPRVERLSKDFDTQAQRVNGSSTGNVPAPAAAARPAASATR